MRLFAIVAALTAILLSVPTAHANNSGDFCATSPTTLCLPASAQPDAQWQMPLHSPPLDVLTVEALSPLLPNQYAKVNTSETPVFASPEDFVADVVARSLGTGFIYVSIGKTVEVNGQELVRINANEYVRRGDLSLVSPSGYHGVAFASPTLRPFAWLVRPFQPRLWANGPLNPAAPKLNRYAMVQIYDKKRVGDYDWYMVGAHQWIEQRSLGIVEPHLPPEGVSGKWVSVNLYEQTMAVYEDERLVYASLVSSGLGQWPTRPGTFRVYSKLENSKMSGAYAADKSDYYFLEDVPWILYFDKAISFHGTYWHDGYGFQKSHGCVNLSPQDARWLYGWAEVGTTVYVYDPSGRTPSVDWGGGGP